MSDLSDIADGDPRRTRLLHACLERLADSENELLREMARTVLAGDVTLREVVSSQVYGDELARSFTRFWSEYQEMTPEERAALDHESPTQAP
ncbi:hypothetical protein [Asanoa iriomotensis]|uniref:Uncharacterized protein n=1 Tax=Asanoa iriomotensis TaxID=234613 RepID=A0ABQ4C1J4_9ACTN|nr:hypothetical protein [Asanoa iriomotensis]GIF56646.1 hypothetical protein Air01nite_27410 [Asanoa iriomotensis]